MLKKYSECPVEITINLIGNKWKILIIRDLLGGKKRFGELKKSLFNISPKVLSENLQALKKAGLISRKIYPQIPPKVEYRLTKLGKTLIPIFDAMVNWGNLYKNQSKKENDIEK